jgi:DNA-directed RNA polymerase subunit omega
MIFPLEEFIQYEGNMYEITCASSRRAYQLSMLQEADEEEYGGGIKVVSLAASQVFTGEVAFRLEDGENAQPGFSTGE